jgi:hypothetical protein
MMPTRQAAAPASADVRGFGYGEHLLVWSWRRIVDGRVHCPVMAQEFVDACGDDAREVSSPSAPSCRRWRTPAGGGSPSRHPIRSA